MKWFQGAKGAFECEKHPNGKAYLGVVDEEKYCSDSEMDCGAHKKGPCFNRVPGDLPLRQGQQPKSRSNAKHVDQGAD